MADPIVYDDTSATAANSISIGSATAFSFTTSGSASGSLVDVKLELKDTSASIDGGYVSVTLYNNAAGTNQPGAPIGNIGTLKDSQLNANGSGTLVDIPLAASTVLSPSTRYWVQLTAIGGSNATFNYQAGNVGTDVAGEYQFEDGMSLSNSQANTALIAQVTEEVVCFAAGTLIRTVRGDIKVESLAVSDLAVTLSGEHRPIS